MLAMLPAMDSMACLRAASEHAVLSLHAAVDVAPGPDFVVRLALHVPVERCDATMCVIV